MQIKATIPLTPVPWTPPRRCGNIYYNVRNKEKEQHVAFVKSLNLPKFEGLIRLDCFFYLPMPKSYSKKIQATLKDEPYCDKKPDLDNNKKFLSDILECAGVYKNDSQICCGYMEKRYSANPRTEIIITKID